MAVNQSRDTVAATPGAPVTGNIEHDNVARAHLAKCDRRHIPVGLFDGLSDLSSFPPLAIPHETSRGEERENIMLFVTPEEATANVGHYVFSKKSYNTEQLGTIPKLRGWSLREYSGGTTGTFVYERQGRIIALEADITDFLTRDAAARLPALSQRG